MHHDPGGDVHGVAVSRSGSTIASPTWTPMQTGTSCAAEVPLYRDSGEHRGERAREADSPAATISRSCFGVPSPAVTAPAARSPVEVRRKDPTRYGRRITTWAELFA